jgi:DNA-binding response OmpR family regulator
MFGSRTTNPTSGLLVEYLRERDHTTTAVPEGRAAVQEIEQQHASRYTLIISDLQLPGVDGLGVLRAAHDYLTKPFSLGQTDFIVRRLLERQTLEAENRHPAQKLRSHEADETRGESRPRSTAVRARITELLKRILGTRPHL